jgi:hypothetical protein
MVKAKVQDHILELLKTQSSGVTCQLVAVLLNHDLTAPAILELNLLDLSKQLVFLLQ